MKSKLGWILECFEGALKHEQQVKAGARLSIGDDVFAFAVRCVLQELAARGTSLFPLKGRRLDFAWRRMHEYQIARLRWHIMLLAKECPDASHPEATIRQAAFAGFMLSERKRQADNPHVIEWLKQLQTAPPSAYRAFKNWLASPQPARWKYPELDSWLMLVWPLVEEEEWNYATVQSLAVEKFEDLEAKPLETADRMGTHCKLNLDLRIKNHRSGRTTDGFYAGRTPLHQFALSIDTSLPADFARI